MKRWAWLFAWTAVLALWAGWLTGHLTVAADLSLFLPKARSELQRALVTELREGPTSRLVLLAIDGEPPEQLAELSSAYAAKLRDSGLFTRVENGERHDEPALLDLISRYRYLLSPAISREHFNTDGLHVALQERLSDLASPADAFIQDWLPRDPTGELLALLSAWRPADAPASFRGRWFSKDHSHALLLAETRAPGFDLDAQQTVMDRVNGDFAATAAATSAHLIATGPGPFGVAIQEKTKHDAQLFSAIDSVLLIVWLLLAYRSPRLTLLAALPITTGALAGMTMVKLVYGGIHGITLAFGTTLLGVALDYPVHVFSHRLPGPSVWEGLRHNWPTLWVGVLTACVAYVALVFTDFTGLAQLGVFTVAGLLTAALTTRWLLPPLLPEQPLDIAGSRFSRWQARIDRMQPQPWLAPLLVVAGVILLALSPHPLWQADLSALSPVPAKLQEADEKLRADLGTADVRYVALVFAGSEEQALTRSETLAKRLDEQVSAGRISGYDLAARYLPSTTTQRERQSMLPDTGSLQKNLDEALAGMPFRENLFEPFIHDVAESRSLAPLTPAQLEGTVLGTRVQSLLAHDEDGWFALIPLHGLKSPEELAAWFTQFRDNGARFLDLKGESERLVSGFRSQMLVRVGIAVLVMVLVMAVGLRRREALQLVILPAVATVTTLMAAINLLGIALSLFHLVALMLVVGISIDYGLYLSRDEANSLARARSLHSLSICCLSTAMGFGILALSEIPVLRAIGATVCGGVILGLLLGVLGARSALRPAAGQ